MDLQTFYSFTICSLQDQSLSKQILPIAEKYLSDASKLSNEWGYKTTYNENEGLSLDKNLDFFKQFILNKSNEYLNKNGFKLKKNVKLWVSIFVSEMSYGDQHSAHAHPGALLSGILYLKVPPGSANLEFFCPRQNNSVWLNFLDESSYSGKISNIFEVSPDHTIIIKPIDGLFLLWESWALHRVPKNDSIEPRKTIVFNVGAENEEI